MRNQKPKRRPGERYPPSFQAEAVAEVVVKRRSINAVAGQLGLHPRTLGRWVAEKEGASKPKGPSALAPSASAALDLAGIHSTGDSLADARAIQAKLLQAAYEANEIGSAEESRRNYAESIKVSAIIARLEADRDREAGAVVATPDDIAAARASVLAKIAALREREVPLKCECCGKALTIAEVEASRGAA